MEKDQIIVSDKLTTLQNIETNSVDLIYCDSPFDTRRDFAEGQGGYTDILTVRARLLRSTYIYFTTIQILS